MKYEVFENGALVGTTDDIDICSTIFQRSVNKGRDMKVGLHTAEMRLYDEGKFIKVTCELGELEATNEAT